MSVGLGLTEWSTYGLFGDWIEVEEDMQTSLDYASGRTTYEGYAITSVRPGRDAAQGLILCLVSGLLCVGLDEAVRRVRTSR